MRGLLGAVLILALTTTTQAQPQLVADLNTYGSGSLAEFHKVSAGLRFMNSRGFKWLFDGSEASYLPYDGGNNGVYESLIRVGDLVYDYGEWERCYGKSECTAEYKAMWWNVEQDIFSTDEGDHSSSGDCFPALGVTIPWHGVKITDIPVGYSDQATSGGYDYLCEGCVRLVFDEPTPLPDFDDLENCSYRSPRSLAPFEDGVLFLAAKDWSSRFDLWGGNIVNGKVVETCLSCNLPISGVAEFYVWNDEIYFVGWLSSGSALYALSKPTPESGTKGQAEGSLEGSAEGSPEGEGSPGGVNGIPVDWASLSLRRVYPGDSSVKYSLGAFIDFDGALFFCGRLP